MSFMSVDGARSATKHAGVPAIITVPFLGAAGGEKIIVEGPTDGRKIRLHSYAMTGRVEGRATLMSSGALARTSITGEMLLAKGTPVSQDGGFDGLGDCIIDASGCQDLGVSSATAAVNGNVTYSLVP